MAVYAMSDLHLSLSADKPMDIFGSAWHNYMERIYDNWCSCVSSDDLVIVGGDISWAMYLEEAVEDFKFLHSLPGHKLLVRGNHDYWWESLAKLKAFTQANGFDSVSFLQNDAFVWQGSVISGTRGWIVPSLDSFTASDRKIYDRELIRLELSLKAAQRIAELDASITRRIAVLHYPPIGASREVDPSVAKLLEMYGVDICLYGHLHGPARSECFSGESGGVTYALVSADHLAFTPCNLDL
ncbi:MAG: metallophosphoesterase [Clostridia bacterium]|nr:metallophosphoesterase [Clostridia bacterium]